MEQLSNTKEKTGQVKTLPSVDEILEQHRYSDEVISNIKTEDLLPYGLLNRLHNNYPKYSGILRDSKMLFGPDTKPRYSGLKGFREIVDVLKENGIDIGYMRERELFIKIYRFMATRHVLNSIDWNNFAKDSLFQLVFPQPEMVDAEFRKEFFKLDENDKEAQEALIKDYIHRTNPHDGKQLLNKPWYENEDGDLMILEGSQHKYPQTQLLFDKTTQSCFSFCTYCFRHAQVRGDEDMFIQEEVQPVVEYLKKHKEVTDLLITGGDGAYMPYERLKQYVLPFIEDPELTHIKTLRIGTRVLSYDPERLLKDSYNNYLDLFKKLVDNGVQVVFMSHFSTPREVLNPLTIAAIRRLRSRGVNIKSQSPMMNHISLFTNDKGEVDVDKSAQNWIDLANIFASVSVGFHSIYCARPTGEHHYFTVPLTYINKVFSKIYRSLSAINRPSRYITMTSSGGKISLLGEVEVNGKKAFALKFNEARNMEWMDKVFLAKYDDQENTIANLPPFEGEKHFYEDELREIERQKEEILQKKINK
jgi:L-lysine 2,3-aminomutase